MTFVIRIFGMAAGYFFALIITRFYGAEAMGVFALSHTVLLIASVLGKLGLDSASLRFVAEYSAQGRGDLVKENYIKSLKLVIPVSLLLSFLLYYLSPFIANKIFSKPYLSSSFRVISFSVLPFVILFIHSESLRGLKKIIPYALFRNMSIPVISSIFMSIAVFISRDITVPVFVLVIGIIVLAIFSTVEWLKYFKISEYKVTGSISYKPMLGVALPMLLSSSMFLLMQWTDTIMLGMYQTEAKVGIYNVAMKISTLTSVILFAINSIAAPKFAEFYGRRDMEGLGRVARQSTKMIFWTSLPILAAIFLFPAFILGIFGAEFRTGVYCLLLLTLGQFVNAISGSVGYILQMTGKQKIFQNIILTATVTNIVLNAILIPPYGINGAAVASMVSMMVWNVSSVVYVRLKLNISMVYVPVLKG